MTPPKHIAVLMQTGRAGGGAERSTLSLIAHAAPSMRFTLLLPEEGELSRGATAAGADVRVVSWPRGVLALGERSRLSNPLQLIGAVPALLSAAKRVAAEVQALRPDVFVTNGIKPHIVGTLAMRRLPRMPLVWYLRDSTEGRRLSRAIFRRISNRCDAAIAISRYLAADAATYLPTGIRPDVVYNILEDTPPREARDDNDGTDAPIQKPTGEIWFATIGALTPLKGHDVFLNAAAIVSRRRPDARFLVIGSNQYVSEQGMDYPARLRMLAHDLGLEHLVKFLGQRRDVPRLLRDIDVVVQSNTAPEAFGRTVAEAMMARVPVIASRAWSFTELIEDGRTGWLVAAGDAAALADRMLCAAADPAARREVGERARAFIAGITQPSSCAAAFDAALVRAAAQRARAAKSSS